MGVEDPGPATVEQHAEHVSLVHLHLGPDGQHGVVPDPLSKTCKCCCCVADPFVQFGVQGEVAGDGGA